MNWYELMEKSFIWDSSCKTVNCSVVVLIQCWISFHRFHAFSDWHHEIFPVRGAGISNSQVSSRWILKGSNGPLSSLLHFLTHSNRVNWFGCVWKDWRGLSWANSDIRVVLECLLDVVLSLKNSFSFCLKSVSSIFKHTSPCSNDNCTWSATSNASCGVKTSIPYGIDIELVLSETAISEQAKWASFRSISIFMRIARNWSYSRYSEVKFVSKFVSELLDKWIDITSKASIWMATNTPALSESSDIFNRVVVSIGIFWSRSY